MKSTQSGASLWSIRVALSVIAGGLFVLLLTVSGVHAQPSSTTAQAGTSPAPSEQVFGVGLYGSLTDGMGIDFRHHLANIPFSYQVTIGPWKTKTLALLSLGIDLQYDLTISPQGRLYAAAGYGYYYSGNGSNDLGSPQRFGAGVGYEIPLAGSVTVSAALLITSFQPQGDILPLPSLGMQVYFK